MASVACIRRDEADGTVQVLTIVPVGEGFHPGLSLFFRGKTLGWPARPILAGSEQGFGERVVIADARATVGRTTTHGHISPKHAYLVIGAVATCVIWATDVVSIVTLASRAFALFYALQCLVAVLVARHKGDRGREK